MNLSHCLIRGEETRAVWMMNDYMKVLLDGSHTNGEFAICDSRLLPGFGPPPHVHRHDDEGFYVLEGEVTFLNGDRLVKASPGDFVWAKRSIVHCFKATSPTPARMLLLVTPSRFTEFVAKLAMPAKGFDDAPAITSAMIDRLLSVTPEYGIEMKLDQPLPSTVVAAAGVSKKLWVMGEHVSILATTEQTNGQFTVVDIRSAPGGGPPSHVHTAGDEVIYVIDNAHDVQIGDETGIAMPGDLLFIPAGTRHRYTSRGDRPGRLLSIHTPGGIEAFFEACDADAACHPTPPPEPRPSPNAFAGLLSAHGMTL